MLESRFRNMRHIYHWHYMQFANEPMEVQKANKHKDIEDQEDWDWLCDQWNKEEQLKEGVKSLQESEQKFIVVFKTLSQHSPDVALQLSALFSLDGSGLHEPPNMLGSMQWVLNFKNINASLYICERMKVLRQRVDAMSEIM